MWKKHLPLLKLLFLFLWPICSSMKNCIPRWMKKWTNHWFYFDTIIPFFFCFFFFYKFSLFITSNNKWCDLFQNHIMILFSIARLNLLNNRWPMWQCLLHQIGGPASPPCFFVLYCFVARFVCCRRTGENYNALVHTSYVYALG